MIKIVVILAAVWLVDGDNTAARDFTGTLPNTPLFSTLADCGRYMERNQAAIRSTNAMLKEHIENSRPSADAILIRKAAHNRCYRADRPVD